jgi:glycogen operon protein
MDDAAWQDGTLRTLCLFLARPANGEGADQLLIVCNAGEDCAVTLPEVNGIKSWKRVLDTGAEEGAFTVHDAESPATVYAASLAVFEPA